MSDIPELAQELTRLGIRYVFGIPGEGPSLELLSELERGGCEFEAVGHEGAAALMAGGYGRVTGIPGVSLSIKGPGFSNLLAGIASNWLDRNPSLSLSESYGPGSSPVRMHKRLAHALMVKPIVKAYADNPLPELIPQLWNMCLSEEPGPVHIDISGRLSGETLESCQENHSPGTLSNKAAGAIRGSKRPLIIAGSLATRRGWRKPLESLRIPIFTTVSGKGAVSEEGRWSAGVLTNAGGPAAPERALLPRADLIVGLGLRTSELLDSKPLGVPLVLLDELSGRARGLEALDECCVKEEGICEALQLLADKEWGQPEVLASKTHLTARFQSDQWLPGSALLTAQAVLPPDTRFVLDTGSFCTIGEHALVSRGPNHVMGSSIARSMGVSLPVGIGAAMGTPEMPTVVVVGDGGIRMYPESVTVAVRRNLPLIVMIMSDGYYASVRQAAALKGFTQKPVLLDRCRWSGVFQAMGCSSERIESQAALQQALQSWTQMRSPLVLELLFDPNKYLTMTEGIR